MQVLGPGRERDGGRRKFGRTRGSYFAIGRVYMRYCGYAATGPSWGEHTFLSFVILSWREDSPARVSEGKWASDCGGLRHSLVIRVNILLQEVTEDDLLDLLTFVLVQELLDLLQSSLCSFIARIAIDAGGYGAESYALAVILNGKLERRSVAASKEWLRLLRRVVNRTDSVDNLLAGQVVSVGYLS